MATKIIPLQKAVLSTGDLAAICHVTKHTIISAIERGELRASRTPGGHNRIRRADALDFMARHDVVSESVIQSILVVDPEPFVFDIVCQTLGGESLQVLHARSVFSAGILVERERPDLILFDTATPGLVLEDFRQAYKKELSTVPPRFIAIVSPQDISGGSAWKGLGAENILEKPFGIDKLRAIIQETSTEDKPSKKGKPLII